MAVCFFLHSQLHRDLSPFYPHRSTAFIMLEAQLLMVEKILGFDAQIPAVRRLAKAAVPCRDAVDAR